MSDKPPKDPKNKVIDITSLLRRRKIGWRPGSGSSHKADGNEIPPPPPIRSLKPPPPMRYPKGKGNLAKAMEAVAPVVQIKKHPLVKRAILLLPAWLTPNTVTVFRTLLAIPLIALGVNGLYWWALGLFLLASFLDFLDGAIAEARDSGSVSGEFLDPLGDKIVVLSTLGSITDHLPWPWAPGILMIAAALAFSLTANRLYKLFSGNENMAANPAGKVKLVLETFGVSFCLLALALGLPIFAPIGLTLFTMATGLATLSLAGQLS